VFTKSEPNDDPVCPNNLQKLWYVIYGISRLVLNRLLSFLVALSFSASAGVYWTLPVLRDFAKVPFILALLLLMGLFIRRRMTPRLYWLLALSAGAVMGIGIVLRQQEMDFSIVHNV
jgi:hypothetical protein